MTSYLLSQADRDLIQEIISTVKAELQNTTNRPDATADDHMAPEVYIARTPSEGIAALASEEEVGTGSGSPSDTSNTPGCAFCDIYKIRTIGTSLEGDCLDDLVRIPTLNKKVYNLSESDVEGDTFVQVNRDKFGRWLAVVGGGGDATPPTRYVKCIVTEPDGDGRFDALLMDEESDGKLTETEIEVWIREGNLLGKLTVGKVFFCKKTGFSLGRDVYTAIEKALTVERSDSTQSFGPHIHTIQFAVPDHWDITSPATGVVMIRPDRLTVTFQYCDGDGTLWELEFMDGLLIRREQVEE